MVNNLDYYFKEARDNEKAIGHFNFCTSDQLRAIVDASVELGVPVMVATSEGEADFIGRRQAVSLVKSYRFAGVPIFLNADHHKSFESIKQCVEVGYDTVLFDGSKLSFEDNIAETRRVVEYAKSVNPDMQVEGELGYLRGSSEIQSKVEISKDDYTKPEEAREFIEQTGVERLAVVFGNIHGIVTEQEERLDIDLLKGIMGIVGDTHIVLHGASGLKDRDVADAIKIGVTNVHINTELRVAYHDALAKSLSTNSNETTPYKYLKMSYEEMRKVVLQKLKLFQGDI